MYLLNHKKQPVRPVNCEEEQYLRQALTPETEAFNRQQKILLGWRESHYWVQCSCCDGTIPQVEKPIMALRRLPSGMVVFSLLPSSSLHSENCPYYRLARYKNYENGQKLRQDKRRTDFTFHRHAIEKSDEEENESEEQSSSSSSGPSMPGLQRFLYNLAHSAKTHVFTKDTSLQESKYLYRLTKAANDFTINKKFRLSDFLYTNVASQNEAISRLQATAKYWTGMARPHSVFVLPIDEVIKDDNGVRLRRFRFDGHDEQRMPKVEDLSLSKDCELIMPGRIVTNKKNPALAVVTLADVSQTEVPFSRRLKRWLFLW